MENSTRKRSDASWALKKYRENLPECLALSFSFLVLASAGIALGLLGAIVFLVSIPLIWIPTYFAMQSNLQHIERGDGLSSLRFFRLFGMYYVRYFGVYRLFIGTLKALAVGAICFFAFYLFGFPIAYGLFPAFHSDMDVISSLLNEGKTQDLLNFLYSSTPLLTFTSLCLAFAFLGGSLMYFHHVFIHSLNVYVRSSFPDSPVGFSNRIFLSGYRRIHWNYLKGFFRANPFLYPLLVIGFVGGVALVLPFSKEPTYVVCAGLGMETFLLSFYLPYFFFWGSKDATSRYFFFYRESLFLAEQYLHELQSHGGSDEEIKELSENIENAKKTVEEKEKEEEKPSDEE